jgi:hypothetical protein
LFVNRVVAAAISKVLLSAGGMGEVYQARDAKRPQRGREVLSDAFANDRIGSHDSTAKRKSSQL